VERVLVEKEVIITREKIREFFREKGIDVDVHLEHRPTHNDTVIYLRPRIVLSMNISDELLSLEGSSEIIRFLFDNTYHDMVKELCVILGTYNRKVISSKKINDWILIYNPDKYEAERFIRALLAIDL